MFWMIAIYIIKLVNYFLIILQSAIVSFKLLLSTLYNYKLGKCCFCTTHWVYGCKDV